MLTDGETTNYQLIDVCEKLGIPLVAVSYKNQLQPCPPIARDCFIINLSDPKDGGSHWCGLWIEPHENQGMGESYWFDSFGSPPPTEIIKYLKASGLPSVKYSAYQLQSLNSNYCGQYVVNWLHEMNQGRGDHSEIYKKFLDKFHIIRRI